MLPVMFLNRRSASTASHQHSTIYKQNNNSWISRDGGVSLAGNKIGIQEIGGNFPSAGGPCYPKLSPHTASEYLIGCWLLGLKPFSQRQMNPTRTHESSARLGGALAQSGGWRHLARAPSLLGSGGHPNCGGSLLHHIISSYLSARLITNQHPQSTLLPQASRPSSGICSS